jgi:hypothetical protein
MMSRDEMRHAFAGNPIIPGKRDKLATEALPSLLHNPQEVERVKVLPLCDGKPLVAASSSSSISSPSCDGPAAARVWRLAWQALEDFGERIPLSVTSSSSSSGENPPQMYDQLVYLGEKERVAYFAIDVTAYPAQNAEGRRPGVDGKQLRSLASMFASPSDDERVAFVDARTLMQAANWSDEEAMSELSIAGHVCEHPPTSSQFLLSLFLASSIQGCMRAEENQVTLAEKYLAASKNEAKSFILFQEISVIQGCMQKENHVHVSD